VIVLIGRVVLESSVYPASCKVGNSPPLESQSASGVLIVSLKETMTAVEKSRKHFCTVCGNS